MRKIEFYVPEDSIDLLEQAKPHWVGAAIGALTAAASAYANARQQSATRRNTRNAAALGELGGAGSAGSFQPTALSAKAAGDDTNGLNSMGIADLLKKQQSGATFGETPDPFGSSKPQAGFSNDAKPAAQGGAPGSKEPDSRMFEDTPKDNTNSYINAASSLAGLAQGLAQRPQMQGAPIPQPGPMNFTPTALAQLARRNPYGGSY